MASTHHPETQTLDFTFTVPKRHPTDLHVSIRPATDPARTGYSLLFPTESPSTFLDYPVCSAKLHAQLDQGYATYYGWIQVVSDSSAASGEWQHDPVPITDGLNTPFCSFGPEAQLFDAPSKIDRGRDVDWTCWSFLGYVPDGLISRSVRPVVGVEWGYRIVAGEVEVKELRVLEAGAWEETRGRLGEWFGGWRFEGLDPEVVVEKLEGRVEGSRMLAR